MANFNPNELILDRVRSVTYHDLSTNKMLMRMTSLEDVSLNTTAEGDDVTDNVGALITTIYRAKKATLSGSNSLISLDLAAVQYGTEKKIGTATDKITDYTYEILTVEGGKVTLKNTPKSAVKYIYTIVDKGIGKTFSAGTSATATEFVISGKSITVPTSVSNGSQVFVEYDYEAENAVEVKNSASNFPEAGSLVVYVYFRDVCNENLKYSGKIICPKAKIDPSSIEFALNSTGKHPFTFNMMKDYCSEAGDDELFTIIASEE